MCSNRLRATALATALLLAASALAGCEEYRARRDSITAGLGNSVAHNIAVQTIDPWPPAARNSRINVDGERILIGAERYKQNKSLPPKGLATQTISTGSGGGAK